MLPADSAVNPLRTAAMCDSSGIQELNGVMCCKVGMSRNWEALILLSGIIYKVTFGSHIHNHNVARASVT